MKEKVVLAYSGGLDTTAIIPWLKETFDYDVICVCADCGQEEELDGLEERALSCGAAKLYIEDVTDEFCDNYVVPCVQAHAVYENKNQLGTTLARPLIAKKLKLDPAVMASPLITTIVDTTTLLIYFNIAKLLLHL